VKNSFQVQKFCSAVSTTLNAEKKAMLSPGLPAQLN